MMVHIEGNLTDSKITPVEESQLSPNGLDVKLDKVFKINNEDVFVIDANNNKQHRNLVPVLPDEEGFFNLDEGVYSVIMEGEVSLDMHSSGIILPRSTFMRNGIILETCLYDSGYHGVMVSSLVVRCGKAKIQRGTRIGQFVLWQAEALHKYEGSYGAKSEHDKKYA